MKSTRKRSRKLETYIMASAVMFETFQPYRKSKSIPVEVPEGGYKEIRDQDDKRILVSFILYILLNRDNSGEDTPFAEDSEDLKEGNLIDDSDLDETLEFLIGKTEAYGEATNWIAKLLKKS